MRGFLKNTLQKNQKREGLSFLYISTVVLLIGLLLTAISLETEPMAIGFGMFFIASFRCVLISMNNRNVTFNDIVNSAEENAREAKAKKKYFTSAVFYSTFPAIILGLVTIVICIVTLFFMK